MFYPQGTRVHPQACRGLTTIWLTVQIITACQGPARPGALSQPRQRADQRRQVWHKARTEACPAATRATLDGNVHADHAINATRRHGGTFRLPPRPDPSTPQTSRVSVIASSVQSGKHDNRAPAQPTGRPEPAIAKPVVLMLRHRRGASAATTQAKVSSPHGVHQGGMQHAPGPRDLRPGRRADQHRETGGIARLKTRVDAVSGKPRRESSDRTGRGVEALPGRPAAVRSGSRTRRRWSPPPVARQVPRRPHQRTQPRRRREFPAPARPTCAAPVGDSRAPGSTDPGSLLPPPTRGKWRRQ